jgi:diguanylate cyclase (GGDEF)-like protein
VSAGSARHGRRARGIEGRLTLDAAGTVLTCDDGAAGLAGQPAATIVGAPFTALLAPGSRIFWLSYARTDATGARPLSLALDLLDDSGARVHVDAELRRPGTAGDLDVLLRGAEAEHLDERRVADLRRAVESGAARVEAVLAAVDEPLALLDDARRVLAWNGGAEALTGVVARSAVGRPVADVLCGEEADRAAAVSDLLDEAGPLPFLVELHRPDGTRVTLELSLATAEVRGECVQALRLRAASQISGRRVRRVAGAVAGPESVTAPWDELPTIAGVIVATLDAEGRFVTAEASPDVAETLALASLIGERADEVLSEGTELRAAIGRALAGSTATARVHAADRDWHAVAQPTADADGRPAGATVVAVDISAVRRLEVEVARAATTDHLTGLRNRLGLHEALRVELSAAVPGTSVALVLLDLDGFTDLNDSLGQQVGDAVLVEIAARLRATVPAGALVTRQAGDEFAVLLGGHQHEQPELLALRLAQTIGAPVPAGGVIPEPIVVTASVGVGRWPQDARDADELLAHADAALRHARGTGRTVASYDEQRDDPRGRYRLVRRLRDAIAADVVTAHFQPVVDMTDGHLRAVEALVRWTDAELGFVNPAELVAAAEASRLIDDLGELVIERSCAQLAAWDAEGVQVERVAVNVSPLQLRSGRLVPALEEAARRHHVDLWRLTVELTETAVTQLDAAALRVLHRVRDRGMLVALDDFGTGQSSLARLRDLPVDVVKLDRSFVAGLPDAVPSAFITAFVGVTRALGLATVAEGVESVDQHRALQAIGCAYGQGFLYGRPVPGVELGAPVWPG